MIESQHVSDVLKIGKMGAKKKNKFSFCISLALYYLCTTFERRYI